jgi:hypothetical protein
MPSDPAESVYTLEYLIPENDGWCLLPNRNVRALLNVATHISWRFYVLGMVLRRDGECLMSSLWMEELDAAERHR